MYSNFAASQCPITGWRIEFQYCNAILGCSGFALKLSWLRAISILILLLTFSALNAVYREFIFLVCVWCCCDWMFIIMFNNITSIAMSCMASKERGYRCVRTGSVQEEGFSRAGQLHASTNSFDFPNQLLDTKAANLFRIRTKATSFSLPVLLILHSVAFHLARKLFHVSYLHTSAEH